MQAARELLLAAADEVARGTQLKGTDPGRLRDHPRGRDAHALRCALARCNKSRADRSTLVRASSSGLSAIRSARSAYHALSVTIVTARPRRVTGAVDRLSPGENRYVHCPPTVGDLPGRYIDRLDGLVEREIVGVHEMQWVAL